MFLAASGGAYLKNARRMFEAATEVVEVNQQRSARLLQHVRTSYPSRKLAEMTMDQFAVAVKHMTETDTAALRGLLQQAKQSRKANAAMENSLFAGVKTALGAEGFKELTPEQRVELTHDIAEVVSSYRSAKGVEPNRAEIQSLAYHLTLKTKDEDKFNFEAANFRFTRSGLRTARQRLTRRQQDFLNSVNQRRIALGAPVLTQVDELQLEQGLRARDEGQFDTLYELFPVFDLENDTYLYYDHDEVDPLATTRSPAGEGFLTDPGGGS